MWPARFSSLRSEPANVWGFFALSQSDLALQRQNAGQARAPQKIFPETNRCQCGPWAYGLMPLRNLPADGPPAAHFAGIPAHLIGGAEHLAKSPSGSPTILLRTLMWLLFYFHPKTAD
jgi:hypothetical protein